MVSIEQKLERLYAAIGEMQVTDKLSSIRPRVSTEGNQFSALIDFTTATDRATAANRVSTLLNAIACLKDHLKLWCRKNGKPFTGEKLIDSNSDVAIIHDLWNLDKHGELARSSRSGLSPRFLQPAQTTLRLDGGSSESPMVSISLSGEHGPQIWGPVSLNIDAHVVDGDGIMLGSLAEISLKAVAAWEAEFVKAGIKIGLPPERRGK